MSNTLPAEWAQNTARLVIKHLNEVFERYKGREWMQDLAALPPLKIPIAAIIERGAPTAIKATPAEQPSGLAEGTEFIVESPLPDGFVRMQDDECPRFTPHKDGTCSPVSLSDGPAIPNPDYVTPPVLDRIRELLSAGNIRFSAAATAIGIPVSEIRAAIEQPDSGLIIAAGGWIQSAKAA